MSIAVQWHRGTRWLIAAVAVFALAVGVLGTILITNVIDERNRYDPLGKYPTQRVTTPVVRNGMPITVEAIKCNKTNKPVLTRGSVYWESVAPSGFRVFVSNNTAKRPPGCTHYHYVNPMPRNVIDTNARLFADGAPQVQWRVNGDEIPIKDGKDGVPRPWETTVFTVTP